MVDTIIVIQKAKGKYLRLFLELSLNLIHFIMDIYTSSKPPGKLKTSRGSYV